MKKGLKKLAGLVALSLMFTGAMPNITGNVVKVSAGTIQNTVENLNRGISAVNTGNGMLVSWRFLANDKESTQFKLYRNNNLVYTSNKDNATCYLDKGGKYTDIYRVDTINNNAVTSTDTCKFSSNTNYFDLRLDKPTASGVSYSPNDCTTGDVDGDGEYELFVKWDPSNSKDNSQSGKTDRVFIDCYKLNGKKLWRIDLGWNIRAGAHYTQMLAADYDNDGKAELICKTADGTKDGRGTVIGDGSKSYRNSKGYILSGPEYLTLFEGATGKALDTINYKPGRGNVSSWGDKYGNRVDRFLGAVANLDGTHPSAVTIRGYYTRMTACAYDVKNKKLVEKWYFDTNDSKNANAYGDGNHNCMPADVDGDGKQEIVMGDSCIDHNGSLLWCLNKGHGDALHVGDMDPSRKGLEVWTCHESKPYGATLIDAGSGKTIFHVDGSGDTGRCCADNVWAGNKGAECWAVNDVYSTNGKVVGSRSGMSINFLVYWDGDLERELLDNNTISKVKSNGNGVTTLFTANGCSSNNTTKATPNLSADLFGDWREEVILRTNDNNSLRIFATTYDTKYRITTLMQDPQYRNQVAGQNIAYNQPPHASFYLGSDQSLPAMPNVTVLNGKTTTGGGSSLGDTDKDTTLPGAALPDGTVYMIQNVKSGMYMEVAGGKEAAGTNVQQWGAYGAASHNTWKVRSAENGYYYLYSQIGNQETYLLDLDYGKTADGTNIQIYTNTKSDAQLFKFVKNSDGTYFIVTKATKDKSCLTIAENSVNSGASVVQSTLIKSDSQKWRLIESTPKKDEGTSGGKTTVSVAMDGSSLDLSKYAGKKIASINLQLSSVSSGNGAAQLKTAAGDWIGSADYSFTDTDKVTIDLSKYSNVGQIDVFMWYNSSGATIQKVTMEVM